MNLKANVLLVGLLTAGSAFGQPGVDTDGDGLVTRAEAHAAVDARFERLDANADGAISRDEIRRGFESRRGQPRNGVGQRIQAADTDNDGALSLAELQAVRPQLSQERFSMMDRNGDGLITADERPQRRRP
jgi:Ca2+-binding EF-hand superfamily protein